jgi:DNA helicase-2/ATP-dependent DNA helicase PcrA
MKAFVTKMIDFTDEQVAILKTKSQGHVAVLGCPGSAKTTVMSEMIAQLRAKGTSANRILVSSFSNRAVDRLAESLKGQAVLKTFHSFSMALVRQSYHALGLKKKPRLITLAKRSELVAQAARNMPRQWKKIRDSTAGDGLSGKQEIQRLARFFYRAHDSKNVVESSQSESLYFNYSHVLKPIAQIRKEYERLKREQGLLDYADMLLLGQRAILQSKSLPFQYLFVDECQDMDDAQAELLRLLAVVIPNVIVFGDKDQSVFEFAGGRYRPLSTLMENVAEYHLTRSFRLSHQNAKLASATKAALSDTHLPVTGQHIGPKPRLIKCSTLQGQVKNVLATIRDNYENSGKKSPTFLVLARTKAQLRDIEIALLIAGFPVHQLHRVASPAYMDTLLDILKLLEKWSENINHKKRMESSKIKRTLQKELLNAARMNDYRIDPNVEASCRLMLRKACQCPSFEGRYIGARKVYEKLLRHVKLLPNPDLRAELGRAEPLCARFDSVDKLRDYIARLRTMQVVTTSTIHSAKGGEWDHVMVLNVIEGSLPYFKATKTSSEKEERRLFYVAITRARKQLDLFQTPYFHARSRRTFEIPSRFLTPEVLRELQVVQPVDRSPNS